MSGTAENGSYEVLWILSMHIRNIGCGRVRHLKSSLLQMDLDEKTAIKREGNAHSFLWELVTR